MALIIQAHLPVIMEKWRSDFFSCSDVWVVDSKLYKFTNLTGSRIYEVIIVKKNRIKLTITQVLGVWGQFL